jgi:Predicted membrane protein (DUF2142)
VSWGVIELKATGAPLPPVEAAPLARRAHSVRQRPARVFLAALAVFFIAFGVWSLATPLFGAPDEPVQMLKAVAVAHGELLGAQRLGAASPWVVVTVPQFYGDAPSVPGCFAFKNTVPASCAPALHGSATEGTISIYTGRYPPLYYFLVGLPSLLTTSTAGVYAMRLVSSLLNAIFLALAVMSIVTWSRSRMMLIGLAVAVTPAMLFFGGVINPSGLEVTSATCLWCSSLVLLTDWSHAPPRGLVATVAVSACVMTLVRGLSPLWVAMIGVSVLGVAGRKPVAALLRHTSVRIAVAAIVACSAAAVAWVVYAHSLDVVPSITLAPASTSGLQMFDTTFEHTGRFITEMIGTFGWLDTYAPAMTFLAWYAAIGLVAGLGVVLARRRDALAIVLVSVAAIAVPVAIATSQVRNSGYVWQGKDSLPITVGIPLVAAAVIGRSRAIERYRGRLAVLVAFGLAIASWAAFVGTLRRNVVGLSGPIDFLHSGWRPPLGSLTLIAAETVSVLLLAGLLTGYVLGKVSDGPAPHESRPGNGSGPLTDRLDS